MGTGAGLAREVERGLPASMRRASLVRRFDSRSVVLAVVALLVAYLALVPVGTMVMASFQSGFLQDGSQWTLANYAAALSSRRFLPLFANSVLYALGTTLLSVSIGFGLAWLFERTDAPMRTFGPLTALLPLIIPGILNTVAWLLLLSPQNGAINAFLEPLLRYRPFNAYSMPGMVFIQSMHVTPLAFIMGVAAFRSMDTVMEEAARVAGAGVLRTFQRVTFPLARPAVFAASLLIFVQTISAFEVAQLVGVPAGIHVFVSQIYASLEFFPPDYGRAGALGAVLLVLALVGVVAANRMSSGDRHATITGRGFRPARLRLGPWRWLAALVFGLYFLIAVVLPVATLVWSSLLPTYETPSLQALHRISLANYRTLWAYPLIRNSVINSLEVSLGAGVASTLLTAVIAYMTVKTKIPGRWLLDALATAPIAVPGVVLGVGILFWYLVAPLPFHLYGTLTILVIAFVTVSLPYAMRYMSAGMVRIKAELEEAAVASGASWTATFGRIYVPLLAPSLVAAFLYAVILAFREISAAIFLYSQGTQLVSIAVFDLWSNGQYGTIAALGVVMVALLVAIVGVTQWVAGRFGLATLG